jgi:hypothetical protein
MPNDIPREKTQEDFDREKRTQAAQAAKDKNNANQKAIFDELMQHENDNPPQYPIKIVVKGSEFESDFIEDNTGSLIYASSFDDATSKVINNLSSQDSSIQKLFNNSGFNKNNNKLRLSSNNKGIVTNYMNDSSTPHRTEKVVAVNRSVIYWNIILTDAPPSMLSSYRIANQYKQNYGKGGKKSRKSKKSKKMRKTRKSKKTRRTKRRY